MLNIYTGREDIDKQRYMFARIKRQDLDDERKHPVFLVVPDQFTLETERSAFDYMDVPAFINPIVLSMNRLAEKVLAESGESPEYINQYGKYMLIARLLYRNKGRLELYRDLENSTKFIAQLSDAILNLKTHMISPEELKKRADASGSGEEEGALLSKKLRDLAMVYEEYEEALAEGVPDSTDIARRFKELIPESGILSHATIWAYGFDYYSPLYLEAISAMAARAREVNIVLTAEAGDPRFSLTNDMAEALLSYAGKAGAKAKTISIIKDAEDRGIDCAYLPADAKPQEIIHVERELFAGPVRPYEGEAETDHGAEKKGSALRFTMASGYYSEAEAAAREIIRLIMEEGLRFREILVVCNDQNKRAAAIKRVFDAYGIGAFLDKRREVGHNPVLAYITALPEIIIRGYRADDILRWLGTGLTDISEAEAEELENYTARYSLRGSAWSRPLRFGAKLYDGEALAQIERSVKYVGDTIAGFEKYFHGSGSKKAGARSRTEGLKRFLEDIGFPAKISEYAERLKAKGFLENADHMHGVWNEALGIFAQIDAAFDDTKMSAEEYATVLKVGFASIMMGVLPSSLDNVTIGTMQRTRTGRVKALFVLGANDGELPMFAEDDGLFDDFEKEALKNLGLAEFRREESLHFEEQLAIYKNLSKPTRLLWLSYTAFDPDGSKETRPSRIFERLRALFPDAVLEKSLAGDEQNRAFEHTKRFDFTLGPERMKSLIPQTLSPTSIEKYSRCPFAFLMEKGLKLGEIRKYEVDSMGIGEVYHEALRRFGEMMNAGGQPAESESAWKKATRGEVDLMVEGMFDDIGSARSDAAEAISDEGALLFDKNDPAAVYRLNRLKQIVRDICRVMTEQVRESGVEKMSFEADFGNGKAYGQLDIADLGVSGRIDRIDILPNDRAKVLDYKSGNDKFNFEDIRNGWQLQLMLYVLALRPEYTPVGAAYFRLFEPFINLSEKNAPETGEAIDRAVLDEYKSDGIILESALKENEATEWTGDEAGPVDGKAKGAKKKREKTKASTGERILTGAEFDELVDATKKRLEEIALTIARGDAPAAPKQKAGSDDITACTYCDYRSICNYDTE